MPVKKSGSGYKFGNKGKTYKKRSDAVKQGRAIKASQKKRRGKKRA